MIKNFSFKTKHLLVFVIFIISTTPCHSQNDEIKLYKNILFHGDSLSKTEIDTEPLFKLARKLSRNHPSQHFDAVTWYMNKDQLNEACFIFYLGQMRYGYYNASNPKYEKSNDGALYASVKAVMATPLDLYLRMDIDNYIRIITMAKDFYAANNYYYLPKKKYEENYLAQIALAEDLITTLKNDKPNLVEKWKADTDRYKKLVMQQ